MEAAGAVDTVVTTRATDAVAADSTASATIVTRSDICGAIASERTTCAFVRDRSADKLSARVIPCVFLALSLACLASSFTTPPRAMSSLLRTSRAARGAASGSAASGGAEPGGAESEGAGSGGAEPRGEEPGDAEPAGVEPEGVEPGGAESEGAEPGGAEPWGAASTGGPAATGAGGAGDTGAGGARTRGSKGVHGVMGEGMGSDKGDGAVGGHGGMFYHVGEACSEDMVVPASKVALHRSSHWVIDTGAFMTMTNREDLLDEVRPSKAANVISATRQVVPVRGEGRAMFMGADGRLVGLKRVLLVPGLCANLLSTKALSEAGMKMEMMGTKVFKATLDGHVLWDLRGSKDMHRSMWEILFMEGLMFKEWSERGRSKVTIPLGIEVGTNELSSSFELTEVSHDLGGAEGEAADVEGVLQKGKAPVAERGDTEEEVQQPTPSPKLPPRRTTQGKRDVVRGGAK
ncbi:unnamed protein product [Closterium sp. NIES-53]